MRILAICAALSLLLGLSSMPALSQDQLQSDDTNLQKRLEKLQQAEKQRKDEAAETDKAYQRYMNSQHSDAPAAKVDPWGNIRASDPQSKTSK
jgi:DnaJ-domain-containing protein 1